MKMYARFGARFTFEMGRTVHEANWMHWQDLDERPQKKYGIFDFGIQITQKWFAIAHENRRNEGYASFKARLTFKIGRTGREGKPYA